MKKISLSQKLLFGAGELSGSLSNTIIGFFFLFYLTDIVKLKPALAGIAILIGKLWDSVADPLFGIISDRTKSRFGRRRVYLLFGTVPLGCTFFLLWIQSPYWTQMQMFLFATLTFILHETSLTTIVIPYQTLTAEMTGDYDERTSLTGFRMAFNVIGSMGGVIIPRILTSSYPIATKGFLVMAIVFALVIGFAPIFPFLSCREKPVSPKHLTFKEDIVTLLKNRPFKLILIMFLFTWTSINLLQTMFLYFFTYYLHMEKQFSLITAIIFITSAIFIPLWVKLSRNLGKKKAYIIGVSFLGISILAIIFVTPGSFILVYILAMFIGIGLAAAHVMPHTIIPDTIDYGQSITGVRQEGLYYGFLTFIQKIGTALAIGASGIILQYAGYVPNVVQSPKALWSIRILLGPIPGIFFLIGIICICFYPIDKKMHSDIQKKLMN